MSASVRVRFAPSPTGHLHIGTARTALFNWLFARSSDGIFILRIEDTDRERSTTEFEKAICEELVWLGLNWDEGPDIGGAKGPYRQTEKAASGRYLELADSLVESDRAYHCWCLPEELQAVRAAALSKGEPPRYAGKCRKLSLTEREKLTADGRRAAIRFAVPNNLRLSFNDMIRGRLDFSADAFGDFVIVRQDRTPTYNFAAAVDDSDMGITHVLRGEDHLTNTAKQLMILDALGLKPPIFGHLSMIFGPDKAKLSKRHGAVSISDYRRDGFLPTAITNYLSLLSWSAPSGRELLDLNDLTSEFSLDRVSKSPAVFDIGKMRWLDGQHIRRLDKRELTDLIIPYLLESGFVAAEEVPAQFGRLTRIAEACRTNLEVISEITACAKIFGEIALEPDIRERLRGERARTVMVFFGEQIPKKESLTKEEAREIIAETKDKLSSEGFAPKEVFQTIRLALTGRTSGPELFYLVYVLGPEETRERLRAARG